MEIISFLSKETSGIGSDEPGFSDIHSIAWKHTPHGHTLKAIHFKNKLKGLKGHLRSRWSDIEDRNQLKSKIYDIDKKEMAGMAQKAKIKWSIEGDENSKYYHGILNKKRYSHAIKGIKHEGMWITEASQEVKLAVWSCGNDKTPGPDGFSFALFKRRWDVFKNDIMDLVKEFMESSYIPSGCNSSFITLIPKVSSPMVVNDFRPISPIGIQYKIIAKLLALRLARVVDTVVSVEQTTFIKGRQILDDPLLVNELVDWYKKKKKKMMILKIYFEKAFDSISWDYLDNMLEFMNFLTHWRRWISACLYSARSSVLINGSPTQEFMLHRGLRQGDPLSPFFIIAMEGLHVAMEDAKATSYIKRL
ncbi:RNA-directed DNA polymerase, eukaryota, reverse transcriptase zinc-binding domain protein [Tanacetum coccineum]